MKLRNWLLVMLALIFVIGGYLFFYDPPYRGLISGSHSDPTLIFSHRGFGNGAPDNSMDGIRLAMEAKMAGVDMDGQQTKDGELVIFHDLSVDRLTNGTGRVKEKTLAELKQLDLAEKFGKGFRNSFPGTFEEALHLTQGKGILMIELKVPGAASTGMEEKAVALVQKYKAHEQVFFSSFNPLVLYRLKRLDPQIRTVFIFMDTNWNPALLKEIKAGDLVTLPFFLRNETFRRAIRKFIKPDLLSVNHEVATETITHLQQLGYPIFLWTPESEAEIKNCLKRKPFGVITDEPLLADKLNKES
ncbi:MAG: hypothetical protein EBQ85_01555 [Proteobacteria bacterium]|nr:hypothetical protein [Pseudomonadota bacterium]